MTDQALGPLEFGVGLKTVPELLQDAKASAWWTGIEATLHGLPGLTVPQLLDRVSTTSNSLVLWMAHWVLTMKGVPPCIRQTRSDTAQEKYITWAADVAWVCAQAARPRAPTFTRWRRLFEEVPRNEGWHRTALWVYRQARGRPGYYLATGLGLTDADRQELLTMPTEAMRADRRYLRRDDVREQLLADAVKHPDKSGVCTPEAVAARRLRLLRCHLLAGRSGTRAARYYEWLTGEAISRQAMGRQVEAMARALPRSGRLL